MQNRAIVVFASRWTLDDGLTGSTLHVLADPVQRPDGRGRQVAKITGPASVFSELSEIPGVYDLVMGMTTRDGRGALTVEHASLVSPLDLSEVGA